MDNQIFFMFYNLAHHSVFFDWLAVFFAQTFPYFVVLGAGFFLLIHHDIILSPKNLPDRMLSAIRAKWKEIVLVFFAGGFAWVISHFLKTLFHTPRPFIEFSNVHNLISETGYAFPSGHATFYMGIAFAIFLSHKKAGYWFMFFALLIGIARIIVGVHSPIDILGGFILGALIAYLVRLVYDRIFT